MNEQDTAQEVLSLCDEDYLWFSAETLGPELTQNEFAFIWEALGLQTAQLVLDFGCGHGRISNGLAERGVKVTGIDVMPLFLDRARITALARAADDYSVLDFGTSLLIQKPIWDLEGSRWGAERIVVRDGQIRRSRFTCRCYLPAEIRRMLVRAGFAELRFFGDGSTRLIVMASKT